MLRVSSGIWRGRKLLAPEGTLKPTSDKIRQAVFNIFRPRIFGSHFLDLFAGSGSVGITALSEGAEFCLFAEKERLHCQALQENLSTLQTPNNQYKIYKSDVLQSSFPKDQFDLVFADPFYADLASDLLSIHKIAMHSLSSGGWFLLEHGSTLPQESIVSLDKHLWTKKYGDTALSLFEKP